MEIKVLASSSAGNCYVLSDGNTKLLLECGIPWKQIQQGINFQTSELAGCLVSHGHQDHCKAVLEKLNPKCYVVHGEDSIVWSEYPEEVEK